MTLLRSQATPEAPLHFLQIKACGGKKGWRLSFRHISFSAHETFCFTPFLYREWSGFSMPKAPSFPLLTSSSRSVVLQVCRSQNPPGSSFRLSVRVPVAELLNSHSICSWVMLMLLFRGPHFENCWSALHQFSSARVIWLLIASPL